MNEQPDLSTLPKRMRYVVGVLDEIVDRAPDNDSRNGLIIAPDANRKFLKLANRWEAEDRDTAEREARAEELARDWFTAGPCPEKWPGYGPSYYRDIARKLIDSGWRKADPA